ncbi:MAG: L,D-transpeptidase family protein [Bacteroidota bacterium]|nr:L,D-transpeptidase family protein [Bacteroidota bacterium]MDP4232469.1 L,D-transpeptidase family protein [Bacteroidota bacterium]MDP4241605.1 L,D-transpeptidase family protein [Bacteroidota bacterium]MDP4286349.1 L,D-transpeptidase family protein [Bacteroidota bacterium]
MHAIGRLNELNYWTARDYSLTNDANRQAIIAFQKLSGLPRTGKLTDSTMARISRAATPIARDSMHSHHIEIDLNHQVLLVIDSNDHVARILSVSTGNGQLFDYPGIGPRYARTPRGNFKVFYKITGWRKSPLGLMFDPMYITGGIAVHGSKSVPAKPASHGCIRIPMFAADELFAATPIGTPAIVFGENPKPAN